MNNEQEVQSIARPRNASPRRRFMKRGYAVLASMTVGLFAAQAYAANFAGEATVTAVSVTDNSNAGGTTKQLDITFGSSISMCAGTGTSLTILSTESTLFEDLVKQAQAAFLSGHVLRAGTSNASGTCKVSYLQLK